MTTESRRRLPSPRVVVKPDATTLAYSFCRHASEHWGQREGGQIAVVPRIMPADGRARRFCVALAEETAGIQPGLAAAGHHCPPHGCHITRKTHQGRHICPGVSVANIG
jgi:hypothetical protein